jgi:hypothetical protein
MGSSMVLFLRLVEWFDRQTDSLARFCKLERKGESAYIMVKTKLRLLLLAAIVAVGLLVTHVAPAQADGGGPFDAHDGRVSPLTGDRLAVYCNDYSVDVLGLDSSLNGHFLTTFEFYELTKLDKATHKTTDGIVTLVKDVPAQVHRAYLTQSARSTTIVVDTVPVYRITWTGGPFGADASQPYVKTFSCIYYKSPPQLPLRR